MALKKVGSLYRNKDGTEVYRVVEVLPPLPVRYRMVKALLKNDAPEPVNVLLDRGGINKLKLISLRARIIKSKVKR